MEKEKKTTKKVAKPVEKKPAVAVKEIKEVRVEKTSKKYINARGGRKTSTAQARLYSTGKGEITINGKPYGEYFPTMEQKRIILSPDNKAFKDIVLENVNGDDFRVVAEFVEVLG